MVDGCGGGGETKRKRRSARSVIVAPFALSEPGIRICKKTNKAPWPSSCSSGPPKTNAARWCGRLTDTREDGSCRIDPIEEREARRSKQDVLHKLLLSVARGRALINAFVRPHVNTREGGSFTFHLSASSTLERLVPTQINAPVPLHTYMHSDINPSSSSITT